jgi:hypothetical protein
MKFLGQLRAAQKRRRVTAAVEEQADVLLRRALEQSDPAARQRFITAAGHLIANLEWLGHVSAGERQRMLRDWVRRYGEATGMKLPFLEVVVPFERLRGGGGH